MRKFSKKQYLAAGAAAVIVASGAGVAFAYWTSSGTGSGSASTGSATTWQVVTDAAQGSALTPGGGSQTVAIHVTNNNSGHQQLQSLAVSVANSNGTAWAPGGCSASDFTVTVPAVPAGTDLAGGATYNTTATITLDNKSYNQDGCQNQTVPLYVVAG